jgi:hypothetical protein
MPEDRLPDAIITLIAVYRAAQASIINAIATGSVRKSAVEYTKSILRTVNREIASLDEFAAGWMNQNIPTYYASGWDSAYEALKDAGLAVAKPRIDNRALRILVENSYMELFEAHRYVGRAVNDQIRQAGLEAVAEGLAGAPDIKAALVRKLTDRGVTAIRDKLGREIKLDAYAAMVARSTTSEAVNQATIDQLQELGYDLVKMSSHATACAVCIPLENRVYSISGNDKRFPPLTVAFDPPYANIHPSCKHTIFPYIEKFDSNVDETIRQSNRPYELDAETQKRVDAYKRQQSARRRLRQDRMQWERYKTAMPDKTPKTFSGFRASKRSNSERWRELESAYRQARNS